MKRRDLLHLSATIGLAASLPPVVFAESKLNSVAIGAAPITALQPPADGAIPVAFLLSDDAVVIDFAGPWEVFENVMIGQTHPFNLYTVAETTSPVRASGGMTIVPNYALAAAPLPKVIVIPAQSDPSDAVIAWVRKATRTSDVTMSVCTGAFLLAKTGLLSGKSATTHHGAYAEFAMAFPDVQLKRGARFVESGNLASSGGLSSGIDLALHIVERYYGHAVALSTADDMEYQGLGWMNANSNQVYANRRVSSAEHPICPVCEMDVDASVAPKSTYHGKTYFFCMQSHKTLFDTSPARFLAV
jgi:transcriptional regulator GlxA family with amidase domain/YHS domain-containing protein